MLNTVYQLVRPRQFEITFRDLSLDNEQILVRPTHLSICNADQRYYQGKRPEEVLRKKLPMALIHEGIGRVIYDPTGTFAQGDQVVMIPNNGVDTLEMFADGHIAVVGGAGTGSLARSAGRIERITAAGRAYGNRGEVLEVGDVAVTILAPAAAEFQEIHD